MLQLDFFQGDQTLIFRNRMDKVEEGFSKVQDSASRSRKCQFAKLGSMDKRITSIEERMDILERNICQKSDVTDDETVTSNKLLGEKT